MDIHVDIREFFDTHVWICYGFLDTRDFQTNGLEVDREMYLEMEKGERGEWEYAVHPLV